MTTTTAQSISAWLPMYGADLDHLYLEVRIIHGWKVNPKTQRPFAYSRYFRIGDLRQDPDAADAYATEKAAAGFNTYLARNPVYSPKRGSSKAWRVSRVVAFALDVDHTTVEQALEDTGSAGLPPPTLAVDSGRGAHLYYAVPPLSRSTGTALLGRFVDAWHKRIPNVGTESRDAIRLLRLPGLNLKGIRSASEFALAVETGTVCLSSVHSSSVSSYGLEELIPGLTAEEAAAIYRTDIQAKEDQDREWWAREAQWVKAAKGASSTSVANTSALSSSYPSYNEGEKPRLRATERALSSTSALSSSYPSYNEDLRSLGIDDLYLGNALLRAKIDGPGQRNGGLKRVVYFLRQSYKALSRQALGEIHHWIWGKVANCTSGIHTEEESLGEFLYIWDHMPWINGGDDFVRKIQETLEPHPLRHLIPPSKRNDRLRALADFCWTASKGGTREFYLSTRTASAVVGAAPTDEDKPATLGHYLLKSLIGRGMLETVRLGSRKPCRASVFRIPASVGNPSTNTAPGQRYNDAQISANAVGGHGRADGVASVQCEQSLRSQQYGGSTEQKNAQSSYALSEQKGLPLRVHLDRAHGNSGDEGREQNGHGSPPCGRRLPRSAPRGTDDQPQERTQNGQPSL